MFIVTFMSLLVAAWGASQLDVESISGSVSYSSYAVGNLIDGDYVSTFCTKDTAGRYVLIDLGDLYDVTEIWLWGRDETSSFYLNQMQNIKITVAMLESAIDDDDSLCVYRDGAPAAGENRPEKFECADVKKGRYVKVSMVNVSTNQFLCMTEVEVYGAEYSGPAQLNTTGITESSTKYSNYAAENLLDGDYSSDFCTQEDSGRYAVIDLGDVYEVTELWVWGRDETSGFYLNQMQNIKITVAKLESAIDDDDSLCVYRDGAPAAEENRPEVFTCTSSIIGRYVKVSMVDVQSEQFFCLAEVEVFGYSHEGPDEIAIADIPDSSTSYSNYAVTNLYDRDYSTDFCTQDDESGRYARIDLGGFYKVKELWLWGREGTSSFYLNQMQNIKITVAKLESAIDDDDSLCVYRDGAPAAGENRPEVFTCTSSMIGRYVKVSMVDVQSGQFFCLAEVEVFGYNYESPAEIAISDIPDSSTSYSNYAVTNLYDRDYSTDFCTQDDESGRYALIDLGGFYKVEELWIWGREGTSSFYLNQMQNIKITVTTTESAIDDDDSLCVYRDGAPAAGENRPEVFTCTSSMIGRYVKVSMVDVGSEQFFCLAEVKVFGYGAEEISRAAMMDISGSEELSSFTISNLIDGDYSSTFCTEAESSKYAVMDLRNVYEIAELRIWGRNYKSSTYLNQMQNIKITVTTTESAIDDDDSLCVYRDGAPAAGENRPEVFTCTNSMIGRYVKVSMVDVDPAQLLCLAELEAYVKHAGCIDKDSCKEPRELAQSHQLHNYKCLSSYRCECKYTISIFYWNWTFTQTLSREMS